MKLYCRATTDRYAVEQLQLALFPASRWSMSKRSSRRGRTAPSPRCTPAPNG